MSKAHSYLVAAIGLSMVSFSPMTVFASTKSASTAKHVSAEAKCTSASIVPNMTGVPEQLIPVYKAAGSKYHVTWTVLAAIHKLESSFNTTGHLKSIEGAEGPMQLMPSTFAQYAVSAPGHRSPNIYNVDDAIYTTAHLLAAEGFSASPQRALYGFNHSISYEKQVMHLANI